MKKKNYIEILRIFVALSWIGTMIMKRVPVLRKLI